VKFRRESRSLGIGVDARISADIAEPLKRLSDVEKVVILTQSAARLGNLSDRIFARSSRLTRWRRRATMPPIQ